MLKLLVTFAAAAAAVVVVVVVVVVAAAEILIHFQSTLQCCGRVHFHHCKHMSFH